MTTSPDTSTRITHLEQRSGRFYFADLHTTNVAAASDYYAELLGWTYADIPGAPNTYRTASVDDRGKAAITALTQDELDAGTSPYWLAYLWVDDIDAAVARVAQLGGTVVHAPVDVFDMGRMALVADPTGARFGMWQDLRGGTTVKDEHGSPFWYELHTSDVETARAFYRELAGWSVETLQMGPEMQYHLLRHPDGDTVQLDAGAMMGLMEDERAAGATSYWAVYFNVDDADTTHARALELGAASQMAPHDIPGAGRSCWLADPQGAVAAFMHPTPPD